MTHTSLTPAVRYSVTFVITSSAESVGLTTSTHSAGSAVQALVFGSGRVRGQTE